jgi:glycosyltransferase involved in cell wall biosynthesis
MRRTIDYLCLQPTREGQASHADVNEIVAGLRRRGWEVRLIEPAHPRPGRFDGVRRALTLGLLQLRYLVACRFRPARFVYIRAHFAALPTALWARIAGSIVIQEVNGPIDDAYDAWPQLRRLDRLIRYTVRQQFRWADAVITVTPGLAGWVAEFAGRSAGCHVVGNGADVQLFQPRAGDRPANDNDASSRSRPQPYVVFVGALASWQGIETILDAARSEAWPAGVGLLVAGDGRERERVREAAAANDRVRWLGTIPYADAGPLVANGIAALVPMVDIPRSRTGLSPLKLFEAMACGVPVVASDLPGLADVVRQHDCGIVVEAGDSHALARAIDQLAADPAAARAMGARGRTAAVAEHSWDVRAGQTEAVLLRVAGDRRHRGRS